MKQFTRLLTFIIIILFAGEVSKGETNLNSERNKVVLSGYVKDKMTGEALIGATVYITDLKSGSVTNLYGFYSVSVDPGTYQFMFAYLGYQNREREITLDSDMTLSIDLEPITESIEEVTVVSKKPDENVTTTQMGMEKLQSKTIKSVPVLMGEVDPIKVIQMLPGVKPTSEGSSGFSVRGGSPDQNLVLLDEATVYNAGHLMGFFSVFNNDAIKDINLYKGDIPASYGGRLASVLDIRMKEGNNQKFSASGGIGLISSRLTLEGPVVNNKTSFIVSGRRTYMDLFLPLAADESVHDNKIYFYDLNAKINHTFDENNRLYLSGYLGRDIFKDGGNEFGFGNQTFTARWNHVFSPRLFSNFTLINSNYDYKLGAENEGASGFIWTSHLTDYSIKMDFNYYLNQNNTISFGGQTIYHRIDPGFARGVGDSSLYGSIQTPFAKGFESAIYLNNIQKLNARLSLRYGLRFSSYSSMGETTAFTYDDEYKFIAETHYDDWEVYKTYNNIEPRLAVTYQLGISSSIKSSYSRTVQYLQLASNSTSGSPLDVWFPSSPNIKPQISDQAAIGYFRNFDNNTIETSVEFFYKDMRNVIDFRDHAELLLNRYLEGEVRIGTGYAYGAELMVRINKEKYSGWISYTYSRAFREIPEINKGKEYRSPYDRPNDISIVLNRKIGERGLLSVNWVYMTGVPVTAPVGRMVQGSIVYPNPDGIPPYSPGSVVPIYSDRNEKRMPDYHRLDIGYTLKCKNKKNRKWQGEWNFSVYNVYGRHNAWMINFEQDQDDPYTTKATRTYLFSFIPSVTYNFKF